MDRAFAMTLDYLRTRQQFGKLIGTFQALQHRAADLKMQVSADARQRGIGGRRLRFRRHRRCRRAAVSRAKARAAEAAMLVHAAGHPAAWRHRLHR